MSNDPASLILFLLIILALVLTKGAFTLATQAGADPMDFVGFVVGAVSLIAGVNVAHLVGPYAAIFVLSCGGAILSLTGNDKDMTGRQGIVYISVRVVVAWCLTVAAAELLQSFFPGLKPRYTLIPIAFGIGYIRDWAHLQQIKNRLIDMIVSIRKKRL